MIQPLITLVIILPLVIGILSVDIQGNKISIREFLKSDLVGNMTGIVANALPSNPPEPPEQEEEKEPENVTYLIDIDLTESEEALDSLNKSIAEGITFLVFKIKDFGVWIGMSTAPFHYGVAVLIGFAIFPYWWMFLVGFFYILIKERKEILNEIHEARKKRKVTV